MPSDLPLWLVIEAAYAQPTVNGQRYVHTVAAEDDDEARRKVVAKIRERGGEGRRLLDQGIALTVVNWAEVTTSTAKDRLELVGLSPGDQDA